MFPPPAIVDASVLYSRHLRNALVNRPRTLGRQDILGWGSRVCVLDGRQQHQSPEQR